MKTMVTLGKWSMILAALLVGLSLALIALEVRVDLSALRGPLERASKQLLGREVVLQGGLALTPSLWPVLELREAEIGNPPGWGGEPFARAGLLRVSVGLIPLLSGKIHVNQIRGEQVTLNLQNNEQGEANWHFGDTGPGGEEPVAQAGDGPSIQFQALDSLMLAGIDLNYRDLQLGREYGLYLEELSGVVPRNESFGLQSKGRFQDVPFKVDVSGGALMSSRDRSQYWPVSLEGEIAGTSVRVKGGQPAGEESLVEADLEIGEVNLGALLDWLGWIEGVEAVSRGMNVTAALRGESLSELLAMSTLNMTLQQAQWVLKDANTGSRLSVQIQKGRVTVDSSKPLRLDIEGLVDRIPVTIDVVGSPLLDYMREEVELPIALNVAVEGNALRLETRATHPLNLPGLVFRLRLEGQRLDSLSQLTGLDLPPVGPYKLAGNFAATDDGYHISGLGLDVGESSLAGDLSLITSRQPTLLDVSLKSKQIRVDDFDVGDWSPEQGSTSAVDSADAGGAVQGEVELLSREFLKGHDAKISVAVDQVLSGKDRLGRGSLLLTLEGGQLQLAPLEVDIPGGSAWLSLDYQPDDHAARVRLQSKVDQFDYGVLARRIEADSSVAGRLSLDVDLSAHVESLDGLMQRSQGRFDFGIWPQGLDAGLFDLWAVNLLSSVMGRVDEGQDSKVNCVIVRLDIEDGVMQERLIYADTTRMHITGSTMADFRKREVQVRAVPRAKRPEFFSLATPVGIKGSFDDFKVRINPVEFAGSLINFVTSPLHVPIRRIAGMDKLPANGEEACRLAWEHDSSERPASVPAQ